MDDMPGRMFPNACPPITRELMEDNTVKQPVQLHEARAVPVPDVVNALLDLLERAKQGEIRAIAYTVDCTGHYTKAACLGETQNTNAADMVYLLEKLKLEIMLGTREQEESEIGLPEDPE